MKFKNREQTIRYRLSYLKRQRKLFKRDMEIAQAIRDEKQILAAAVKIRKIDKSTKLLKEKLDKIERNK